MLRLTFTVPVLLLLTIAWPSNVDAGSTGTIEVRLFVDLDENGSFSTGDVPLGNSYTRSVHAWGPSSREEQTDESGMASFDGLEPGDYLVGVGGDLCADYLSNNWFGIYVLGFCTSQFVPDAHVTLAAGQSIHIDLPAQGVTGQLNGRLWLDGLPAPNGTRITARVNDTICAEDIITRGTSGAGVPAASFRLEFPGIPGDTECYGEQVALFARDRQFHQTTRSAIWSNSYEAKLFQTEFYATSNFASPPLFGAYAYTDVHGPPGGVRAIVNGTVCGARPLSSSGVYGLIVLSDEVKPGCGIEGSQVDICLGDHQAEKIFSWTANIPFWAPRFLHVSDTDCPAPSVPGDADCDGAATPTDAGFALRDVAGVPASAALATCLTDADTDCDGLIKPKDVLAILASVSAATTIQGCSPV